MATALVLVDAQRNMLEGAEPVPSAAAIGPILAGLLARARDAGALVVHVQNDGGEDDPDRPDTPGWELVFTPAPGEVTVRKDVSDAFAANPDLATTLTEAGVDKVVVAGMQSEYCVQATTRGALAAGFAVVLATDAHATYGDRAALISAEVDHELSGAGVRVVASADDVIFAG